MVINCKEIANKYWLENKKNIEYIKNLGIKPKFAIIHINNDFASNKYVNRKIAKAKELGIECELFEKNDITQKELEHVIKSFNKDKTIHGILIQLPLPKNINVKLAISNIDPNKDIDGFVFSLNQLIPVEEKITTPCTPLGIMKIFEEKKIELEGKNIAIINRSIIVGKPLIELLLEKNATVIVCHSKTKKLNKITKSADIIISAVGIPNFINKKMVTKKTIVIDVGINIFNSKLVGDANFNKLKNYVKYITPVPNGVGQLTLVMFFFNLIKLIQNSHNI